MIRDYLGQVSSAAQRLLPKGDRLLFVGRTRAAIEARVGPLGSADDADAVAAALTALGDPEELAKQERERLYSARGATPPVALWKPAKEPRRGTRPRPQPPRSRSGGGQPWKPRPWPSRGSAAIPEAPGTGAPPQPDQASGRPSGAGAAPPPGIGAAPPGSGATPPGAAPSAGAAPSNGAAPGAASAPSNGLARPDGVVPPGGPAEPGGEHLGAVTAPGPEGGPGSAGPGDAPAAADTGPLGRPPALPRLTPPSHCRSCPAWGWPRRSRTAGWPGARPCLAPLAEAAALARKNPLETVCVLLIGVGGVIFPFPMWLIGGLVALRSRRWDGRDKRLALLGPPLFAVVCVLILGATGNGSYFHVVGHALHQFGLLLRVGCLLCAGYLVWRLRRGPRARKTPPWLRPR